MNDGVHHTCKPYFTTTLVVMSHESNACFMFAWKKACLHATCICVGSCQQD